MTNSRSAYNAWTKIKVKLMTPSDGTAPSTPIKGSAKKKAPTKDDGETPSTKASGKRAAKKQDVDGEGSPKKKGRGKKAADAAGELSQTCSC